MLPQGPPATGAHRIAGDPYSATSPRSRSRPPAPPFLRFYSSFPYSLLSLSLVIDSAAARSSSLPPFRRRPDSPDLASPAPDPPPAPIPGLRFIPCCPRRRTTLPARLASWGGRQPRQRSPVSSSPWASTAKASSPRPSSTAPAGFGLKADVSRPPNPLFLLGQQDSAHVAFFPSRRI